MWFGTRSIASLARSRPPACSIRCRASPLRCTRSSMVGDSTRWCCSIRRSIRAKGIRFSTCSNPTRSRSLRARRGVPSATRIRWISRSSLRRRFKRWVPDAYELMARATLRHDRASGDWILACPREYEAHVFSSGANPDLWPQMAHCPVPVKLVCGDPTLDEVMPPALIGRAMAEELGAAVRSDSGHVAFSSNRASRRVHPRGRIVSRAARTRRASYPLIDL